MRIAYSPIYKYDLLPEGHRFPMQKYEFIPQQLLLEGVVNDKAFFHPKALSEAQILRTHTKAYWQKLSKGTLSRKEILAMGFPFHASLVKRGRHIAHGTLECAYHAFNDGIAMNIAGGTHHAYADRGEGFCMFNDFAITANELIYEQKVNKVLIIDLDVHQGNGNAKIFERNDNVFTFSMHGQNNYPLRKEKSDLDIGLPDKINDEEYLKVLEDALAQLMTIETDIIFYLSGVDILETDKLGKMGVSIKGCNKRDQLVFEYCKRRNKPVIVSMGGGYSTHIKDIVKAHTNTFKAAKDILEQ
jgi:acetoin utilization deacetylase AcuC-like enzyme